MDCLILASSAGLREKKGGLPQPVFACANFPRILGILYVRIYGLFYDKIYPTFPRGQKQVVAGLLPFLETCGGGYFYMCLAMLTF